MARPTQNPSTPVFTTYSLNTDSFSGASQDIILTWAITVPSDAPLTGLTLTIMEGQRTTSAAPVNLQDLNGNWKLSGTWYVILPVDDVTFSMTATNKFGTTNAGNIKASLSEAYISYIIAIPSTISSGGTSVLSWYITGADSFYLRQSGSTVNLVTSGRSWTTPALTSTTTYVLTATKTGTDPVTRDVTVTVRPPTPTVSLTVSNDTITEGSSVTLRWSVSGHTSFSVTGGGLNITSPASGSRSVSPITTTNYTIRANNTIGSLTSTAIATVTVTVNLAPLITSFTVNGSSSNITVNYNSTVILRWVFGSDGEMSGIIIGTGAITAQNPAVYTGNSPYTTPALTSTTTYTLWSGDSSGGGRTQSISRTITVRPQLLDPTGNLTIGGQNYSKVSLGTAVIERIYKGAQLFWQQGTPPTISSFTVTPTTINLDSATPTMVTIAFSIAVGATTVRIYLEPQGTQLGRAYTVGSGATNSQTNITHPRPTQNQTYRLVASTTRGEVHQDRTVTVTQSAGVSDTRRINFISGTPAQYTFTARIVGYPQPAVSYRFSTGETNTLTASHLTPVSGQVNTWILRFVITFNTVQNRNLTITAGTARQTLNNIDG